MHLAERLSLSRDEEMEVLRSLSRVISANQLSLYGAVAEMCEECESCHDRTGGPVVGGPSSSSFVPSVMKTNIPLTDDPAQEEDLLQRCRERIEKVITTRQSEQILY